MEILLILFGVIVVANLISSVQAVSANAASAETKTVEKCPPHKWRHEEIIDPDGEVVGWKLICDKCGPLKVDSLRGSDDGIY
jgi:hypothetical protein